MKSAMAADAMTNVEFQSEMIPTGEKADEASDNEMLPEASADLRTNLQKQHSSILNSVPMSRERFLSLSLCPKV